ncbi:hypothetical protein BYZ73_20795 [Rhodovulum viride]|uniref:HTH cro/C1-type domain-containing protein n=1 Tax=Rhodovulum viride TaxID=1231134 RepID=A0ABX9DAN9_9RHOB|nr:helix-turn-helix domain-containing protein [Rhodovulum viride]RAP39391.1 hypothetical protein BYZ73_20795 [Rhodovulum viride]
MGLRIKELREGKRLSQQQLAEMAGLSRSQLSEIENERKPANTLRLTSIARALNVTVEELFTSDPAESYKKEILDLMREMAPEDREALIRYARAMASPR